MGILNKIIKKDEKEKNVASQDHDAKKTDKKDAVAKSEPKKAGKSEHDEKHQTKQAAKKKKVVAKENTPISHFDLIRKPHISEKAFYSGEQNKYVFKVAKKANKTEVKKAVQNIYGVLVEKVNIINVPEKAKMYRGRPGEKSGYKKAVVKLKKGQTIDVIEGV